MIQLSTGSPASPPAGTRPVAMAPAIAPKQYGTSKRADANAAPKATAVAGRGAPSCGTRSSAPRSTMPSAARVSGTNRVRVIDAYAVGNDVQSTTKMKISHTWLASHTGPMEWSITVRGRSAALGPAGDQVPDPGTEVGAAEDRVRRRSRGGGCGDGRAHRTPAPRRAPTDRTERRGRAKPSASPGTAAHAAEHEDGGDGQREVEEHDADEGDPHAGVAGGGVFDLHVVVDDPRLPSDLGDDPPRLHRDDREHAARDGDPQEPLAVGQSPPERPVAAVEERHEEHRVPRPTITSHARWTMLTCRSVGRSDAGTASRPWTTVAVPSTGPTATTPTRGSGCHR